MTIKEHYDEYINTIYPQLRPVGPYTYGVATIYLGMTTIFILIGLILDFFTKNHSNSINNIKILGVNILFLVILLISWFLLKKGVRNLINRLTAHILIFLNHVLLLYFFATSFSSEMRMFYYFLLFSLGYLLLNPIYQMIVISKFREKPGQNKKMQNIMYIPFGFLCALGTLIAIYGTITNSKDDLFVYVMIILITVLYQVVIFEFVFATKGEKVYQEQLRQSRYGNSVSKILKNQRRS